MSAATVYISESNGAGEVVTDNISNINFGSVDQPNIVAANHPIIQGENGYSKYLRVKVASLGSSTTVKDLRIWKSAGAYLGGESILTSAGNTVAPGYATPNPTSLPFATGFLAIADPGGANIGIAGAYAGTIVAPGYSNYFALFLATTGITPLGSVNQKTITIQYDET